jgi:hypothetical protein
LAPTDEPSVVAIANHTLMQLLSQMSAKVVRFDDAADAYTCNAHCSLVDGLEAFERTECAIAAHLIIAAPAAAYVPEW